MRIRFGWLLVLVFSAIAVQAQSIDGSVYSSFGFGDLRQRSSSYTRALGYTSIAVRDAYNINVTNPAALTSIASPYTFMFEIGTYYGTTYSNTTIASKSNKYGGLTGINGWFRASKKVGISFGVSPLSNLSYHVVTPRNLGNIITVPVTSAGTGGINQFYAGIGVDVIKNLSVGANLSFVLGDITKSDNVPATTANGNFDVINHITARGGNIDFGLQYALDVKKSKIIFGAVFDPGAHVSGFKQKSIVNPISFDTLINRDKQNLNSRLPPTYGAGLGFRHGRSTIAVDGRYLKFTKARFDETYDLQDSYKFSVGYEFRGDFTSFNYLKSISFRAGAWGQNYPVIVQGAKLSTWGYTLGVALPIQNNRANVSLNYSFTQNGVTQNELVREQGRILSLDVIFRDVWGIKRKFD